MTKDEKIDKLLGCYVQVFTGAIGEVYTLAFGEVPEDNEKLNKRLRDMDMLGDRYTEFFIFLC